MAHPKRKISKSRRDKRRTHYKLEGPEVNECKQTGQTKRNHHATVVKENGRKVF